MQIAWDPDKATSNQQKHRIDFADAATVFDDEYLVSQEDLSAQGEQRFVGTGMDAQGRILTVVYALEREDLIRLFRPVEVREERVSIMPNTDVGDDIPEVVYDPARAKRGALNPMPPTKERITIRLDQDILAWFKQQVHEQGGGNYQTLINEALREYIQGHGSLEATLRRVIHEELHDALHAQAKE